MIGLGKMGGNMSKRLVLAGHEIVGHEHNQEFAQLAAANGVAVVASRDDLVKQLDRMIIWLMIPAEYVDQEVAALLEIIEPGSTIIDGGNSDYRLTKKRYELCKLHDVSYVDVGTSGGVLGFENGYSMMVGGDEFAINELAPLFTALAPQDGWQYFGESGAGHYVKMVHNAIEYGVMESYAEGYRLLREGPFDNIELAKAGEVWQNGSIISSLLNELTVQAIKENPQLTGISGAVAESGETRWALETADSHKLDLPAIKASMRVRLESQAGNTNFATQLLAAMRNKFGGHDLNEGEQNENS